MYFKTINHPVYIIICTQDSMWMYIEYIVITWLNIFPLFTINQLIEQSPPIFVMNDSAHNSGLRHWLMWFSLQELALYEAFTIGDTLRFFGRLHNMKSSEVQKRTRFLLELLTLPDESRMVKNLRYNRVHTTLQWYIKIININNVWSRCIFGHINFGLRFSWVSHAVKAWIWFTLKIVI